MTNPFSGYSKAKLIFALPLLAALMGLGVWRLASSSTPNASNATVADSIRTAMSYPIYIPADNSLPAGYTYDESSFRETDPGVIIFKIKQRADREVIVSEQAQPSSTVIENFIKNYIPLNTSFSTRLGQLQIGANGYAPSLRTIASISIRQGPWLIITAPSDIKHTELKQIVESLVIKD